MQYFSRHLAPFIRQYARAYVKGKAHKNMELTKKQVHQESLRYIHPFARININSDIDVHVRSADVHEYPNADVLIVQLFGNAQEALTTKMDLRVSDDDRLVNLVLRNSTAAENSNFQCLLKVPIRAELQINTKHSAEVSNIYGEEISVQAAGDIEVAALQARKIQLHSDTGNIKSNGLLLGKHTRIATKNNGSIELDKLQGDNLHCESDAGDITVNSCYVEKSKFETQTGDMLLKNVHKRTEVIVVQENDLTMTGVHGNMFVRTNGGTMNLQLSELEGENIVIGDNMKNAQIHISNEIEENTHIEITSSPIELDASLAHLSDCLTTEKHTFELATSRDADHKLLVAIKGGVKLGKLSWADSLMATMTRKDKL